VNSPAVLPDRVGARLDRLRRNLTRSLCRGLHDRSPVTRIRKKPQRCGFFCVRTRAVTDRHAMIHAMKTSLGALLILLAGLGLGEAQDRKARPNANACLVWTANSLLANPYYLVARNDCAFAIQFEYRYEQDVGAGCAGAASCPATMAPREIKRFTAGMIRTWVCRAPAIAKFPDINREGRCE